MSENRLGSRGMAPGATSRMRKEGNPMMNVTPHARDYLVALRTEANLSHPDMALRLVPGPPGRLGLLPGVRNPGDRVVTHGGLTILLLAPAVASALDRATLDARDGRAGRGLVVRPPRPRPAPSSGGPPAHGGRVPRPGVAAPEAGARP